jgi:hypothetical protein
LTYPLIIEELRLDESSLGRFFFEYTVARWATRLLVCKRAAAFFASFVLRPSHAPVSPLVAS